MFVGAIESEFRRWFVLNQAAFQGRTLFVGCSGNFTIEQLLGNVAGAIHSNDVSIYTHFVGNRLAGQKFVRGIKSPEWQWLQPFLDQDEAATMVLLFEVLKWDPAKNAHNKRLYDEYMRDWDGYFAETSERVEKARSLCQVSSYRSSDIWDFVDEAREIDPDGIFTAYLPPSKGRDERLNKKLDAVFSWEEPGFEVLNAERKAKLIEKIKAFDHVFIDDFRYAEEPAVMLKKTAKKQTWIYSNLDLKRIFVQYHAKETPANYRILEDGDVSSIRPDSTVILKFVSTAEINHFRDRYLSKGIDYVDRGVWSVLLFVDGKLLGFAILTRQKYGEEGLYLLSDFSVPAARESRLSKLVLLLLQSSHFQQICEELVLGSVPKLTTTAFTEKPVSQKYRSAGFELVKRGEHEGGKKFLNYETRTGLHSDREAIAKWIACRPKAKKAALT